jgi:hypothetical protein
VSSTRAAKRTNKNNPTGAQAQRTREPVGVALGLGEFDAVMLAELETDAVAVGLELAVSEALPVTDVVCTRGDRQSTNIAGDRQRLAERRRRCTAVAGNMRAAGYWACRSTCEQQRQGHNTARYPRAKAAATRQVDIGSVDRDAASRPTRMRGAVRCSRSHPSAAADDRSAVHLPPSQSRTRCRWGKRRVSWRQSPRPRGSAVAMEG